MTNPICDLYKADTILVIGSNTTENHPIFANYIVEAVRRYQAKLIVADPRRICLTQFSHTWLRQKPGTDVALINGLMNIIIANDWQDSQYIDERTEGFQELKECVENYTPDYVSSITGVPEKELYEGARLYSQANRASILYAMGITQHSHGTDNVKSLANLAMLCGNVGIEGGGVNPLRGQNNVQGACDLGALPNVLTGYQPVTDQEVRQKFSKAWQVDDLKDKPGLTVTEMMPGVEEEKIKALYIMGENPVLSDPDKNHIEKIFDKIDFLVVQEIFLTETAKKADVVLPGTCFAEKDGTVTNSERKVQRVRKALDAPGEAKDDLWIISALSQKMGYKHLASKAEETMREINQVTPSYGGITYDRLEHGPLTWPCPTEDHPGTPILHINKFTRGLGAFFPIEYKPSVELPDDDYPFYLSTGRVFQHYHTGTMTRKGRGLNLLYPEALAEINPQDAEKIGISDGQKVRITSRRGSITVKSWVSDRTSPGTVFVPFHFNESPANALTNTALDPVAKIPEYKVCAVKVEKVA